MLLRRRIIDRGLGSVHSWATVYFYLPCAVRDDGNQHSCTVLPYESLRRIQCEWHIMRNPFLQKYKASNDINDFQQWGVSQARNPATPWSQTSTISINLLIQNEQICRAVQPSISVHVFFVSKFHILGLPSGFWPCSFWYSARRWGVVFICILVSLRLGKMGRIDLRLLVFCNGLGSFCEHWLSIFQCFQARYTGFDSPWDCFLDALNPIGGTGWELWTPKCILKSVPRWSPGHLRRSKGVTCA